MGVGLAENSFPLAQSTNLPAAKSQELLNTMNWQRRAELCHRVQLLPASETLS